MGLAAPSFATARQDQSQQDQMETYDIIKRDDGVKHDDMSKDVPKN
jgi:hypothetical protein